MLVGCTTTFGMFQGLTRYRFQNIQEYAWKDIVGHHFLRIYYYSCSTNKYDFILELCKIYLMIQQDVMCKEKFTK